jgi:hypothetical protein
MKFEEFKASLKQKAPPSGITASLAALWYAGKGDWDGSRYVGKRRYPIGPSVFCRFI